VPADVRWLARYGARTLSERQLTGVGCRRWTSSSPPRHGWERAVEVVDRVEHPALGVPRIAEEQTAATS